MYEIKKLEIAIEKDECELSYLRKVVNRLLANEKVLVEALIAAQVNAVTALEAKDAKIAELEAAASVDDPAFDQTITDATTALVNATTPTA